MNGYLSGVVMSKLLFSIVMILTLLQNIYASENQKTSSNAIRNYYIKNSKEKVEHLQNMASLSIEGSKNDTLHTNILTSRNSRLSQMLADDSLSAREKMLLDTMDTIASNLLRQNRSIVCSNIVTDANAIAVNMTNTECVTLNSKITSFYEVGVYGVGIPSGSILDIEKTKANINTTPDNQKIFSKIQNQIQNDKKLIEKIAYMNQASLDKLCTKLLNTDNKTLYSKAEIAEAIRLRVLQIGGANCAVNYVNNLYTAETRTLVSSSGGSKDPVLLAELAQLQIDLVNKNKQISDKNNEIATENANKPVNAKLLIKWQKYMDELLDDLAVLNTEKATIEANILIKQRELNG